MVTKESLDTERLDLLLGLSGIASEFIEFSGNHARISLESRLHVLSAMGIIINSPCDLEKAIEAQETSMLHQWLPATTLTDPDQGLLNLTVDPDLENREFSWELKLENGETRQGTVNLSLLETAGRHTAGDRTFISKHFSLGALPVGYHQLSLVNENRKCTTELVVPPLKTWQPPFLNKGGKCWGLSVQLYSVRTAHNWGIGDFADLMALLEYAAGGGADFILLNPLHALDLRYPENASPYSPSDRRFLNPLYISLPLCAEFSQEAVQSVYNSAKWQAGLANARNSDNVDYGTVCRLKMELLGLMFTEFQKDNCARNHEFNSWVSDEGPCLTGFADFQARRCTFPELVAGNSRFQLYLQWLARQQLKSCQQRALDAGMKIGLVRDLAVGSSADGSEVQENPGLFCLDARIGAPPDYYNPQGQNWGLPPLHPMALQENRFRIFIDLLRANMQDCGALRIDHVMALMRLWWCPMDGTNATGAYVHYPVEMLFALLRLESVRHQCAVIGEDLGVVPPEIRSYLDDGGIYSNCVFYFEKYDGWHFRKPEHYKEQALAMIANHDTATLKAWWNCSDLALRRKIGLIPSDENLANDLDWRNGEKEQLLVWLQEQGLLPPLWNTSDSARPFDSSLLLALVSACARISSRLVSLQLDDIAGAEEPVNIPGTSSEYANWRRKLPLELDEIFSREDTAALLHAMSATRKPKELSIKTDEI